jgi:type I restriction enzyme S subunit
MSANWQVAALGEVVRYRKEFVEINDLESYKRCRVQLHAQGIILRDIARGAEIKTKKQQVCRTGEFLVAEIDAKVGGFGIVPPELDGAIVSSHYFLFGIDETKLDRRFLDFFIRTPGFRDQVTAQGSTNYAAIRPNEVLGYRLPLPSLEEQRRIVARIEELAAKIEEARRLRKQTLEEAEKLIAAEENRVWPKEGIDGAPSLEEVTTYLSRGRHSEQGESNHFLIKTQHVQMGKYVKTRMTLAPQVAAKVSPEAMARKDDLLIACSAAGCLGRVARFTDSDVTASTDTHVAIARANAEIIAPEYLYAYLRGAQGQVQLRSRERGDWMREKVGFRLTELNLADLKRVPVPLPPISEQRRIVEYLDNLQSKMDVLKRLQAETAAELDALLPSILDKAFKGEL